MVLIHVILWWHIENQCMDWLPVITTAHWNHLRRSKKCQSLSFIPYQWNRILEREAWVLWLLKLSRWFRRIAMIENWEYKSRVYFSFGLKDTKDNGENVEVREKRKANIFDCPCLVHVLSSEAKWYFQKIEDDYSFQIFFSEIYRNKLSKIYSPIALSWFQIVMLCSCITVLTT